MEKNDMVSLTIEDISAEGFGVGRFDGMAFFVKDTVPGDEVEASVTKLKKTYGYARLTKILKPSPHRVKAVCPVARSCGGCQIQEMSYEQQLVFKENKVRGNLERIGKFTDIPMDPIIGMENPFHYRNKAQFPIGLDKNGNIVAGFYAGRTHTIIDNRRCCLGAEVNERILDIVIAHMEAEHILPYDEKTGRGLVRHVLIRVGFATGQIMVCLVVNGTDLPGAEKLTDALRAIEGMTSISLNFNRENTNVILGRDGKLLWGKNYIEDFIGNVKYQISPLSFFQVNPVQTEKLYGLALEYAGLDGGETVWDMYCGIGTISLFLAQKAGKVYGVEVVPQAIDDACRNARINGIDNAQFFVGKAEEILPSIYQRHRIHADVIVVDPPRKGCDAALLNTIIRMQSPKVVYVSCDSATLARDLRILCDHGYALTKCRAVDMFPMTGHVETVALMTRTDVAKG